MVSKIALNYLLLLFSGLISTSCAQSNPEEKSDESKFSTSKKPHSMPMMQPKIPIKTVGILLYDGYTNLDATGPYEVLSSMMGTNVFFVAKEKGIITDAKGMKIMVDTTLTEVKQLDILVVPGGLTETYKMAKDKEVLDWIQMIDKKSTFTTSVCMGSWILASSGVLDGQKATSHWYGKTLLKDEFNIDVVDKRYVQSGKYWTSAGVTAGMDMCLALVNEIWGEQYTKFVMLNLEYDPKPPFDAGSESKTEPMLVGRVRSMYDDIMSDVLESGSQKKN